ncbi:Protein transport protein use1 [Wickerhamiella sorbophila]|uniref:Protein transport protein use1 n=1 Tax=Wickerhamiella sorbophila TaxID=45607 RepID=A0A2T0FPZ0_9ASCO|nr:Protein transport protein use1 [Wickerhamiella sorbophila]PRT57062.1 Protein transport protein use1 [Wickerhamiella sorbophila]
MALLESVDEQTLAILGDCDRYDDQVLQLRLQKVARNFQVLQKQIASADSAAQARHADQLLDFQDRLASVQLVIRRKAADKVSKNAETPSESSLGSSEKQGLLDELNSLPVPDGLRHRGQKMSNADHLAVQDTMQQELSENILEMVRDIRKNAEIFSEKLAADSGVVDATGDALNKATSKMDSVGSKLNKYRKTSALGFWFYVKATLFIVGALIGGMLLVQLMPKW